MLSVFVNSCAVNMSSLHTGQILEVPDAELLSYAFVELLL